MRILVVGAGATGGFVGGRLMEAGRDVTFLVRERRAKQIREHGLSIVSPLGDVKLQPKLISTEELRRSGESFDLILLTVKAYQLEGAMEDMAPAVGPETMVLPVLNGIRHLDTLDERFGAEKVLGGTIRVFADMDVEGRIHQISKLGELSYGERSGERTKRIEAVHEALSGALFDTLLQPDILAAMWQKWWILSSLGAICILARGTIGEAVAAPRGRAFIEAVVREPTAIAEANGYPPNPGMLADHMKRVTQAGSGLTSSMYRDMIKGSPVEADHILGDLLDRTKGVDAPLLSAAYVQLKVYEGAAIKD